MNKKRYIESYNDLCKSTVIISLSMFVLHLFAVLVLDYVTGGAIGKAIAAVLLPHLSYIKFVSMYIENFKYLAQKQVINNSKKLFWYGMAPFLISELLNVATLVLFLCL